MQSQDFSAHRPSLSNALSWMSLIVLVQAPDRMLLSREILLSNHSSSSGVHRSARQSKRPHQGPRSASLSPNPWSRPSQPDCPVKIKTTSGKQEQWNGDNSVSLSYFLFKKNTLALLLFFLRNREDERLHICNIGWVYFRVSTVVPAADRSCLFPHSAKVWLHFGRSDGTPFFFSCIILIGANVPQAKRAAWWFMPGLSDLKVL